MPELEPIQLPGRLTEKQLERFWGRVEKEGHPKECWEWKGATTKGHGTIRISRKQYYTHRLSWEIHYGSPGTLDVLHQCDNGRCVNPEHLFLGTQQDNMQDMNKKGRRRTRPLRGEENSQSKLTWDEVREIRIRYSNGGVTIRQLSQDYGVSPGTIGFIIDNKTWVEHSS